MTAEAPTPLERSLGLRRDGASVDSPGMLAMRLDLLGARLDDARRRMNRAIELALAPASRGRAASTGVDGELVAALRRARGASGGGPGPIAEAERRLDALLGWALSAGHAELRRQGRTLARSSLGSTGGGRSTVLAALTAQEQGEHLQRLALDARMRRKVFEIVLTLAIGLTRLAVAYASGGAAALPALLSFMERMLDVTRDLPLDAASTAGPPPARA